MKISSISYYFSKKNLLILKEIKKKELINHHTHPKRRLSRTDHQSALGINESENLSSSSTSKKVKRRNEDDNDNDENDHNEILTENDK